MQVPRTRVQRHPVHGVLLLDKPLGLSSNQALQKVKWLLRAEKAGHTGTLDPLATGVLPLCFGAATKFSQMHLDADKTYQAILRLGVTTTTADAEGEVLSERPVCVNLPHLNAVVTRFTGSIAQMPPMYSALKKDGKPLYAYAREGIEVERAPRQVVIHSITVTDAQLDSPTPSVTITVCCSKGTYIRTLAEDMGEALGCGAHLIGLRRIQTGDFGIAQCVSLESLTAQPEPERINSLMPVEKLLSNHETVLLDSDDAARFLTGMRRKGNWLDSERVSVFADHGHTLLGTAHIKAGYLIPLRLLSPIEIKESCHQANPLSINRE
jgi:tRNA pseudouridine55 synthase